MSEVGCKYCKETWDVNDKLIREITKLESQLKSAREVIEFYGEMGKETARKWLEDNKSE